MSSSKTGEATPRPWVLHHPSGIRICDGAHESLGGCLSIAEAEILGRDRSESVSNAAFIVEAVNSYDALRAENEYLKAEINEWRVNSETGQALKQAMDTCGIERERTAVAQQACHALQEQNRKLQDVLFGLCAAVESRDMVQVWTAMVDARAALKDGQL